MPVLYPNNGADCEDVNRLIEKCNGDRAVALGRLIGGSCSYKSARQLSVAFSHCFGLTEVDFTKAYRKRARLGQRTFEVFANQLFEIRV